MSTETAKINYAAHQIILNARERLEIRGVTEVVSFDEQSVVLNTVCGGLSVEGSGLHVNDLSVEQGIVALEGRVDAIGYYETDGDDRKGGSGFFGRIFRS